MRKIISVILLLFLAGCMSSKSVPKSYQESYQQRQTVGSVASQRNMDLAEASILNAPAQGSSLANARSSYTRNMKKMRSKSSKQLTYSAEQQNHRMMHYNGFARLRVTRIDETIDKIISLTRTVKGKLENRGTRHVSIRVPRENFEEVFGKMLAFGDVISKSITAEDVTEQFTSVELRLKTSKATRTRLLTLLEKTKVEKEKIQILKQIQRLNEQIDTMEAQLRTLSALAKMSQITIELQPRQATAVNAKQQEAKGFHWLQQLSPFQATVTKNSKRLSLDTPKGMVILQKKGPYVAKSADGATLRSGKLKNQPKGSSTFWRKAILKRLQGGFAKAELLDKAYGDYQAVRLLADGEKPYVYVIAVRNQGKYLQLIEIYYPSLEHEKRYDQGVRTILRGGAS